MIALGGNPTNAADTGTALLEDGAEGLDYIYARRVGAADISYTLNTLTDLVHGTWTNTGYTVVGTGPVVDDYETVTNRIDTAVNQRFVELVIEEL